LKRALLGLLLLLTAAAQAQYVTLTGQIQGSNGVVADNYTISFQPNQWFFVAGTAVVVSSTTNCATSVDGSVVGIGNPLQMIVATPAYSGGTLTAGNYYVEYSFYTPTSTETLLSPETTVQLTSTGQLNVASPAGGIPSGASGMRVYIGASSGAETYQGDTVGAASFVQSVPLVTGSTGPPSNTTVCQQIANDAGWPPGTGYKVALADSSGNVIPGYPMLWQLLGPNTTIDLSNGLPYYHGVVVFPPPILASPYNHNAQSISGPLNFGGYSISGVGNLSASGAVTAGSVNTVVNPTLQPGADIGAQVNNSFAGCANQCTVHVPAGTYNQSTQIVLPLAPNGLNTYWLDLDPAAVLRYSGSGCQITTSVQVGPTESNIRITGGTLIGTSAAACGVQILPTNGFTVRDMALIGFASGPGIWVDGANAGTVENNYVSNSGQGVLLTPTYCSGAVCGPTVSGATYTPNNVKVLNNDLPSNGWGVQSSDPVTAALSGALGDVVAGNDVENEFIGAISWGRGHGTFIGPGNYIEGSPQGIVLGESAGSNFYSCQGCTVAGNYFTETTGMPIAINLLNTTGTMIYGNSEQYVSANANNCFINGLSYNADVSGGELYTTVGPNHTELASVASYLCENATGSAPAGVLALTGTGSYTQLNQNYLPLLCNSNYTITSSGTSETAPCSGNTTAASQCFVTPLNSAGVVAMPSYYFPSGNNTGTLQHPSGVNTKEVNIWCSGPPN
jgi:hypothetical protein